MRFTKYLLFFLKYFFNIKNNSIIKTNKNLNIYEMLNVLNRRQKQKFYLPDISLWPILISIFLGLTIINFLCILYSLQNKNFIIFFFFTIFCIILWFSMFFLEKKKGNHVFLVRENVKLGFYLFLFTEVLCFMAIFWIFLHSFLAAGLHVGLYNPGEGSSMLLVNEKVKLCENSDLNYYSDNGICSFINLSSEYDNLEMDFWERDPENFNLTISDYGVLINPYKLPFYNTLILLCSAATLNCSHVNLKKSNYLFSKMWLIFTIFLGIFFVYMQYNEYKIFSLNYNDGIYSACFFSLTGLHGTHVILGIMALFICFLNLLLKNSSINYHQSFFYAIIYWHFVDIIWIFVFIIIYYWPSSYFFNDNMDYSYVEKTDTFSFNLNLNNFLNIINNNYLEIVNRNNKSMYESIRIILIFDWIPDKIAYKKMHTQDLLLQTFITEDFKRQFWFFEQYQNKKFDVNNLYCEEFILDLLVNNLIKWNFNEIKKNCEIFNFVLNEVHPYIFSSLHERFLEIFNVESNYWFEMLKRVFIRGMDFDIYTDDVIRLFLIRNADFFNRRYFMYND